MRFPSPPCNLEDSVESSPTSSTATATAVFPRIWTPLHNGWVQDSEISCYDQFRQFFAKIPAIPRQNTTFSSILGKNLESLCKNLTREEKKDVLISLDKFLPKYNIFSVKITFFFNFM